MDMCNRGNAAAGAHWACPTEEQRRRGTLFRQSEHEEIATGGCRDELVAVDGK